MAEIFFHSTEELIQDLKQGRMIILVDDEDRENEGDLVLPAQFVRDQDINFMAIHARGLICLALSGDQADKLGLKPMVGPEENQTPNKTAFTVSIEAAQGVTTGISAADRAHTIRMASQPTARALDVRSPGHVFPIRAREGGVLKRAGHTEGSVDLAKLAGLWPASVICEIMKADGSMARVPDLMTFAREHNLKMGSIADLIKYRLERETLVKEINFEKEAFFVPEGWELKVFENIIDGWQHLVFIKGTIENTAVPLVRIQQDDYLKLLKDVFSFSKTSLAEAFERLNQEEVSVLVLLRGFESQEKLGARLGVMAGGPFMDSRDYGLGAQILRSCGVTRFKLLTNHVEKRVGLKAFGLELLETVQFD